VSKRHVGRHASFGVPLQTLLHKVQEVGVLVTQEQGERFAAWLPQFASRVLEHDGLVISVVFVLGEELAPPLGDVVDLLRRDVDHLDDAGHLIVLGLAREDGVADVELSHDAAEAPHVDRACVGDAKHDLGGPVEPGLDIGVDPLIYESRGPEVDYLDSRFVRLLQQDVLRLQIAVDYAELLQVLEGVE